MKTFLSVLLPALLMIPAGTRSQAPDSIYMSNIQTVRLYKGSDPMAFPFINLNGNDQLELHFDDVDADVKNYYYTYQLCNYDWTPANVMSMEYLSGFSQNRITEYRFSSVALTRYTHYRVVLPQSGSYFKKSGNYILRVYLNGDTSQTAFTKRVLVLNSKAIVSGLVTQPTTPRYFNKFQKLVFNVNLNNANSFNPQQEIRVVVLQDFRWDNAAINIPPTFIRGNNLEYNSETSGVFPAGKEWRWLDIRDFHLQTDRVASADYNKNSTTIYLQTDRSWATEPYIFYPDLNGLSTIQAVRGINPFFEGDYATVHFSFAPPGGVEFNDRDIYLYGQLTNYNFADSLRMTFNAEKRIYETKLFLKQGYYDYTYLTRSLRDPFLITSVDGDDFETENAYTVLVYYRPFGARADELIAISMINSRKKM